MSYRLSWSAACAALVVVLGALCVSATMPISHDIRPGHGVTELRWLSDYHPALRGTPGDTPIYVLEGDEPGGSFLLLGGTHPNEIAGVMAATLFVERASVSKGTVFVIPHANNSASRYNDGTYNETSPQWIELTTASGEVRTFHYGSRRTQVEDQEPDPEVFVHYPSGIEFDGKEARNLNRNHPGIADGTLTQQISYALFQLVEREEANVVVDMHESSITSRLAHMIVCHPRALDIGAMATLDLEWAGIIMKLEVSQEEYHGLSHREFGDYTDAYVFLIETPNPGQERSITTPDVVNDPLAPLADRVRTQISTFTTLVNNYSLMSSHDEQIEFTFPFEVHDLVGSNLGEYLR